MKCQTGLKRFVPAIVTGIQPLFSLMESAILIKQPLCAIMVVTRDGRSNNQWLLALECFHKLKTLCVVNS